ncbi:related to RRP40 - protein involved in ribosomal RNA processing, component of the exosome complex [Ustilago sp. UG-2017a]|nr:related to RRP40 - protein involved in ribosomal RNA processing, component of the exosome complex [Ustilago sp. UG-2017a]SPC61615.1 related to RRP40 - protein involved in ribosomal RNA processing, component of the exosome complex [Ustilago sp. UG-2017b]
MTVVLPGDIISIASTSAIKLGPGLLPTSSTSSSNTPSLTAIRAGALGHIPSSSSSTTKKKDPESAFWVETNTSRYVPAPGDPVIAQITNRGSESFTLTLFSSHSATLPALSFEGATKRHKPNLRIGSLVYARILTADRFTEPELTCVNPVTGKSDGFGDLKTTDERGEKNGVAMLFRVTLGLAKTLLAGKGGRGGEGLLKLVAAVFPFEAAVGANGVVWVRANETRHVLALGKVLDAAEVGVTQHGSEVEEEEEEEMGEAGEGEVDAERVIRNRASGMDAKRVRAIVSEHL